LPVELLPDAQYALCFNYSVGKRTGAAPSELSALSP
jgi:hypothetical protein